MDIESIKTFTVLAHNRSFTRTADQLFVAQSTVTNRINELEKELGFLLFKRTNRSVDLTPEGERFKIYAEKVIELTDTSLAEISSVQKYDNYLRIGCADSIYEGHLAPLILKHRKTHPKDYLKISIGFTDHLLEQIQKDMLDVVFTYLPLHKNSLHCKQYKQDTLVLVTDIKNEKYRADLSPIDPACDCPVCRRYSRAYLRHLFKAEEMLAMRFSVMHNLYFYNRLMERIRTALEEGSFASFRQRYSPVLDKRI